MGKKTYVPIDEATLKKTPKSFVVRSGAVGKSVSRLVSDVRNVMMPNTARNLKEKSTNKVKDFIEVASSLYVTHLLLFARPSDESITLRIARVPRGPTIGFRVLNYMLSADVCSMQKRPKSMSGGLLLCSPMLVLNDFNTSREHKLLTTALQNMYPPMKVTEMKLNQARRVVMFSYDSKSDSIHFRHYSIDIALVGVTKGIKKLMQSVPDLHEYEDISEFIQKESKEAESDVETTVTITEDKKKEKRAINLVELGPRMELKLIKIQDGFCAGKMLYHRFSENEPDEEMQVDEDSE